MIDDLILALKWHKDRILCRTLCGLANQRFDRWNAIIQGFEYHWQRPGDFEKRVGGLTFIKVSDDGLGITNWIRGVY